MDFSQAGGLGMAAFSSQAYALPAFVAAALKSHSGAEGAVDGSTGLAWLFSKKDLLVWRYDEGAAAEVHMRTLPYTSSRRHVVAIAIDQASARLLVALCSDDGNLAVWPDFCGSDAVETQRLAGPVTAAAASPLPGGGFAAAVATAAAQLFCVRAQPSPDGVQTSVTRFTSAAAAPAAGQQAGMLGRLFAWGGASTAHTGPSAHPAKALHFVAESAGSLKLLALTTDALDCWKVDGRGEQLLWSQNLTVQLQQRLHADSVHLLDLTIVPAARGSPTQAAILASSTPSDGGDGELSAHVVEIRGLAPAFKAWQLLTGVEVNSKFRFNASMDAEAFLLWWPGGLPIEWAPSTGAEWLETPGNCLAASISQQNSWVVLTPSSIVEIPVEGNIDESEGLHPSMPAFVRDHEPSSGAGVLMGYTEDAAAGRGATEEVFAILDEATASGSLSPSGYQRLRSAGCFQRQGPENPIARYSTRLADVLPKHWGGPVGGAEVAEQLAAKKLSHNSLLAILADAGVLPQLAAPVLRVVLENGERLSAVAAVREAENRLLSARARPGGSSALELLQRVIGLAGAQCTPQVVAPVDDRSHWEVFYSYPSFSAPAFFGAAAAAAEQLPAGASAADAFEDVHELAKAVQGALQGALVQRGWHMQRFPAEVARALRSCGSPEWLVREAPRAALLSLSHALIRLRPALQSEAPERGAEAAGLLLSLAERLLNAFAAAVPATDPTEPAAVEQLVQDYAAARSDILQDALNRAIAFCTHGDARGEGLLQRVESLAQAHAAHAQLFDLCEFLGDSQRLHDHMAANAAEDLYAGETTAQYVFGRLAREGRHSELLSLPDPFNQDLHTWLLAQEQGPEITELRWLHELRMRDYGRAAATLARSAVAAGGGGGDGRRQFARCGRAARLAKLALLAGQPGGLVPPSQQAVQGEQQMNSVLALLEVQQRLGLQDNGLLPAHALAEAALQASSKGAEAGEEEASPQQEEAALLVFDVLAAAGQQLNGDARGVLEAAWRRALAATDWRALAAARSASCDADFGRRLGATLVARAAARCFGPPSRHHRSPLPPSAALASPEETAALLRLLYSGGSPAALSDILAAFGLGALPLKTNCL